MAQGPLQRLINAAAAGAVLLRVGIVGVNFAIMMGLAAYLGLATFGTLALYWGIVLVLGTVVSLGGPLIILRRMTDGGGMDAWQILWNGLVSPLVLAGVLLLPLYWLWPSLPWSVLLGVAIGVNALSCLASVLRGMGSVNMSMALRDAGPQVALGLGVLVAGPVDIVGGLTSAGAIIATLTIVVWSAFVIGKTCATGDGMRPDRLSLWATSMLGIGAAQMDLIVGGLFLPPEALGLYALLRRIANLVALPVSVATWVSAGPVSASFGAGDMRGLQEASNAGNRVALFSGVVLFLAGVCGLAVVPFFVAPDFVMVTQVALSVLLCGAFVQVWFASGYTVATLCGFAYVAAFSRLVSLVTYTLAVFAVGTGVGLVLNAVFYTGAVTAGSVVVWFALRRHIAIDTAASALWQGKPVRRAAS